ncbi:Leucine Rich Repeat [Seminavis robusta]|uniref:Leucine Rich Repeat n=1 Tax=Seminavis robusta TaxID=568900 RepID=A0A9N8E9U6_9STRA|nr:Leucine Rich Repeat [Seminavis robusta]|eukprot:Sro787_g202380.1 Leucine Rich Repeat (805) ;mRNA; f:31097-33735
MRAQPSLEDSLLRALEDEGQYGVAPEEHPVPTEVISRRHHFDDHQTCVSSVTDALQDADLFVNRMYPTLNEVPEEEIKPDLLVPSVAESITEEPDNPNEEKIGTLPEEVATVDAAKRPWGRFSVPIYDCTAKSKETPASTKTESELETRFNGILEVAKDPFSSKETPTKPTTASEPKQADDAHDLETGLNGILEVAKGGQLQPAQREIPEESRFSFVLSTPIDTDLQEASTSPVDPQLTVLNRTTPHSHMTDTLPGAYAQPGPGFSDRSSSEEFDSNIAMNATSPENMNGLAIANPVEDNDFPTALPHEHENDVAARQRANETKQFKTKVLLGVIFMIAIILLFMVTLLTPTGSQPSVLDAVLTTETAEEIEVPTSNPSQAPTSISTSTLKLFPMNTTAKILEDPDSPQARAFDWLMEEGDKLESLSEDRIIQKLALVTLFFSTSGDLWANSTSWLNHSVHECEWHTGSHFAMMDLYALLYPGYLRDFFPSDEAPPTTCNDDGIYQHLWLDSNGLAGSLPDELYLLTSLKTMSFAFHQLQGSISSYIGQLSSLEGLAYSYAKDGSIPTAIGHLESLRWLLLLFSDLTGTIPTEISQATNLEWLTLWETSLSGTLPVELMQLSKLESLSMFDNSLQGRIPSELGQISSLTLLSAWGNQLTGPLPSELGLLTNLAVTLNIMENQLSGTIPTELGLLSGLVELEFSGNQFTGQIPSELGELKSIGRLTFANNSFSGTLPQELTALHQSMHTISLEGNPLLSGSIPEDVCNTNVTCIGTPLDPCRGPYGLSFDCSRLLCGCECPCVEE